METKTIATVFLDRNHQPFKMGKPIELSYPVEPRNGDTINYGNIDNSDVNFYTSTFKTDFFRVTDRNIVPSADGAGHLIIFVIAIDMDATYC